ncbi:MAG: hypothetical protein II070_05345, partial [Treponema sp.]|nr:hypothetical protein [Treponema sp.]
HDNLVVFDAYLTGMSCADGGFTLGGNRIAEFNALFICNLDIPAFFDGVSLRSRGFSLPLIRGSTGGLPCK